MGWLFDRWDGEEVASSTSASTTILLDEPKELKAIFKLNTQARKVMGLAAEPPQTDLIFWL